MIERTCNQHCFYIFSFSLSDLFYTYSPLILYELDSLVLFEPFWGTSIPPTRWACLVLWPDLESNAENRTGMKVRWREVVDSIIEHGGQDVKIEDIASFVCVKARAASHPVFGKISEPLRSKPVASNKQYRPVKVANYATSGNQSLTDSKQREEHKSKPQCPLCSDSHYLARCEHFRKMSLKNRMKFVKEKRLCNNCLTKGHFVNACTKDSFCKVEECDGKHSTFLHPKAKSEVQTKHGEESAKRASIRKSAEPLHASIGLSVVPVRVKPQERMI